MEKLEQIFTQFNPIATQKPLIYMLFMGDGQLPFSVEDATGLWNQWVASIQAPAMTTTTGTHIGGQPIKPPATPFQQYRQIARTRQLDAQAYGQHWITERAKFFKLFEQFALLEQSGKKPVIAFIHPSGKELHWTPTVNGIVEGQRGPRLQQALQELKVTGQFALGAVVQYAYADAPSVKRRLQTDNPAFATQILKALDGLRLDTSYGAVPTFLSDQLDPSLLIAFWDHYSLQRPALQAQAEPVDERFQTYANVYREGGFEAFFDRFVQLGNETPSSKLVMASFIFDNAPQQVLYRLTDSMTAIVGKRFVFSDLPHTEGTKLLISKVPPQMRVIIKALYTEQDPATATATATSDFGQALTALQATQAPQIRKTKRGRRARN
jgi:hypothetical protein